MNVPASKERVLFARAYDSFIKDLNVTLARIPDYEIASDLNPIEPELRNNFKKFLKEAEYPLALKNLEALFKEKSGGNFLRNDGSVGWYHEFIPLISVLSLIRKDIKEEVQPGWKNALAPVFSKLSHVFTGTKKDKQSPDSDMQDGISIEDMENYGGVEGMICTHLRHDSVEDHTTAHQLYLDQLQMIGEIMMEYPFYDADKAYSRVPQILTNIDLMTQKKLTDSQGEIVRDAGGKALKEDVVEYVHRMVVSPEANPVVFILKQVDGIHNLATMLGAEKFDASRRLKRCNDRENMYGARFGFTDLAIEAWPKFSKAIQILDGNMGVLLYTNFRYLESVDEAYKDYLDAFQRKAYDYQVSSRFLKKAILLDVPEKLHMVHMGLRNMSVSVDAESDPEKHKKLDNFLEKVVKPALERNKDVFGYMFKNKLESPLPALSLIA